MNLRRADNALDSSRGGKIAALAVLLAVGAFILFAVWQGRVASRDDSGSITSGGRLGVSDLEVGDCLHALADGEVAGARGVPCDEEHENEVFHRFELQGQSQPEGDELLRQIEEGCLADFEAYVGRPYFESQFDFFSLAPGSGGFILGDREVLCLLFNLDGSPKVGSAKGSGQ